MVGAGGSPHHDNTTNRALKVPVRSLNSQQLAELEAEFQAIIDSGANAARRCASLCLSREQVAAEEERHRQLTSFAERAQIEVSSYPRAQKPQPPSPREAAPQTPPRVGPAPVSPPVQTQRVQHTLVVPRPWMRGFYDEKTRAVGGDPSAEDPDVKEDGESSDEDYERILKNACSLKDKVHTLLLEDGQRQCIELSHRIAAAKRCDVRRILEMTQSVQDHVKDPGPETQPRNGEPGQKRRGSLPHGVRPRAAHAGEYEREGTSQPSDVEPSPRQPSRGVVSSESRRPPSAMAALLNPSEPMLKTLMEPLPSVASIPPWEPEAPSGPSIRFHFVLRDLDWTWLSASPGLVGALEAGLKDAIAEQAGPQVHPSNVSVTVAAGPMGAVKVQVNVLPADGVDLEAVQISLAEKKVLADLMLERAGATHGLAACCHGQLTVGDLSTPKVQEQMPCFSLATPLPVPSGGGGGGGGGSSETSPASLGSTARLDLAQRKIINEGLGKELAELAAQLRRSKIISDGLVD